MSKKAKVIYTIVIVLGMIANHVNIKEFIFDDETYVSYAVHKSMKEKLIVFELVALEDLENEGENFSIVGRYEERIIDISMNQSGLELLNCRYFMDEKKLVFDENSFIQEGYQLSLGNYIDQLETLLTHNDWSISVVDKHRVIGNHVISVYAVNDAFHIGIDHLGFIEKVWCELDIGSQIVHLECSVRYL